MVSSSRAFTFITSPCLAYSSKTHMERHRNLHSPFSRFASGSTTREGRMSNAGEASSVTLQEWQGWGTTSPVPAMVTEIVEELKSMEKDIDSEMTFGGNGGKLQGYFKVQEDKKHRATYQALDDPEKRQQFFSARQIACRLLGSRGYLCQKCWLPSEDCMCLSVKPCSLWNGIRFWLYMHPKDFLRQNNTGKLLWQVFGVEAATLCLYGIPEHEEIMWNAFKLAGKSKVWCLYPNKNTMSKSVQDVFSEESPTQVGCPQQMTDECRTLNFILIDGTWSNSAAMFRRLKEQTKSIWGEEDLPCISLATGASAMHKLRTQDVTLTVTSFFGSFSECLGLNHHGIVHVRQQQLLAYCLSCNSFKSSVPAHWINRLMQ